MLGISTSICADSICYHKRPIVVDAKTAIANCLDSGFRTLDFSFHNYARDGQPIAEDSWREWLMEIRDYADSLGVSWYQGHAFIYPKDGVCDQHNPVFEERIRRSIIGAGIMGVKTLVLHPRNFFIDDDCRNRYDLKRSKEENIRYISSYLEEVERIPDLKLAIENLFLPSGQQKDNRYCSSAEELVDLVDTIGSERVGICWDFGHANISGQDQCRSLETIGERLIATHVHDNAGTVDEHLAPFFGRMDWPPIMAKLKEIGYKGYFTLEVQHFAGGLPPAPELRRQALKLSHDIAEYLSSL
ncbi:MAG: sugar phosphate isomerase/epimerase [Spirochaetales bacterium]|nr:sugar phosphate isomerase/epimerase [Spirochaetales bacterium]